MIELKNAFDNLFQPSKLIVLLYIINFLIAITIVFLERKDPSATLAWIMVLFAVPVAGIILYFFFSQNIARQKVFFLTDDEEILVTGSLAKQADKIRAGTFRFNKPEIKIWDDLIELNQNYGRAYFTQNNSINIFADGKDMIESLLSDIKNAEKSINVMFFILKNDETGRTLIDALAEKAKEGVKVRLLLDALGSRRIGRRFTRKFIECGGEFATFFPPKFRILEFMNSKLNYRNHRKIVAIDNKIGYIGGFNVAKEYVGLKKKFGYWRDTHLRIEGGSVQDINARFLLDWRCATNDMENIASVFYEPKDVKGDIGVQIVSCGPDSEDQEVKRAFMKMITSAKKNIYIQTPYFVPDAPILESVKMAAQSGVDVKIMIPCKADHVFVYWATYAYCGEIIKAGGRVFIYDKGFLHAKTMTADGQVVTVGSTNFDVRSFKLNFESNAFVYDEQFAKKMEDMFNHDISDCHELTRELYDKRSRFIKIKEPFARLLSGIL